MRCWTEYNGHDHVISGRKEKYDNTIYSFDIETTSYLVLNDLVLPAEDYENLTKKEQQECKKCSCMYIWMFSINDTVYYGRTWEEFVIFMGRLNEAVPELKIIFVHNLAFEFQYIKSYFKMKEVMARVSHKVMKARLKDYNVEFRCSYIMTNSALAELPKTFNLPVKKLVGNLDYNKVRTPKTTLTEEELAYCENDCLVVYHYIRYELQTYENVKNIPLTATGHVRRELKNLIRRDYKYKRLTAKMINTNPVIYAMLCEAFAGGFTHANYTYASDIIENVDSWDFTSSYPYVMVTHRFPSDKFTPCNVKRIEQMNPNNAYLMRIRMTNVKSKYWNNFISQSKCRSIKGGRYDNGRVIKADSLEITLTDVDFRVLYESYSFEYEILECYYSIYRYLPKQLINFILDKYVLKTQYKDVPDKKVEYQRQKSLFNSIYGMCVTNTIRDEVTYNDEEGWSETPLTNEEIIEKLKEEEKQAFLSFSTGCWVTAYARSNLMKNIIAEYDGKCMDDYMIYADTDSLKLREGYPKEVIDNYNAFVERKIKHVSEVLQIPLNRFAPKDIKGKARMLGLFDDDGHYLKFITQGAKKYCYLSLDKNKETGELEEKLHITVSGVPKKGVSALKGDIRNFKDNLVFTYEDTGKSTLFYCENQEPVILKDLYGVECEVHDKSGCCLVPNTYTLGKALEYAELLEDSSHRAIYNENV